MEKEVPVSSSVKDLRRFLTLGPYEKEPPGEWMSAFIKGEGDESRAQPKLSCCLCGDTLFLYRFCSQDPVRVESLESLVGARISDVVFCNVCRCMTVPKALSLKIKGEMLERKMRTAVGLLLRTGTASAGDLGGMNEADENHYQENQSDGDEGDDAVGEDPVSVGARRHETPTFYYDIDIKLDKEEEDVKPALERLDKANNNTVGVDMMEEEEAEEALALPHLEAVPSSSSSSSSSTLDDGTSSSYSSSTASGKEKQNKQPFPCARCEKRFSFPSGLRRHMLKNHEGKDSDKYGPGKINGIPVKIVSVSNTKKTYTCLMCDKGFKTHCKLKEHCEFHTQDRVGKGQVKKPFSCSHCARRFATDAALTVHLTSHFLLEKDKPYACDECPRRFMVRGQLMRLATSHKAELPLWWCALCQKEFVEKVGLDKHVDCQHNPYCTMVCEICGGRFVNRAMLHSHQILLHGDIVIH